MADPHWRPLRSTDLGAVVAIADAAFPQHFEDPACFAERLALAADWCFGLDEAGGALQGYLIAYRWPLYSVPPLNASIGVLPESDALFLHDLALRPGVSGRGLARDGVQRLIQAGTSAGLRAIALVAVNDTVAFWLGQKFVPQVLPALDAKLASYGQGARYMRRELG